MLHNAMDYSWYNLAGGTMNITINDFQDFLLYVVTHLPSWILWAYLFFFCLPVGIYLLLCWGGLMIIFAESYWYGIKEYEDGNELKEGRIILKYFWKCVSRFWHGQDIVGLENIPDTGGAVLITYHGTIPHDCLLLITDVCLQKNRWVKFLGDKFLFKMRGIRTALKVFGVFDGPYPKVVEVLKQGKLVLIYPGGLREALFSDHNYRLLWNNRTGFARAAIEAEVPIIPVITKNIQESFRTISFGKSWFRHIYEKVRLPIVPIYGWFPVKLKTYIGEPIPYDPNLTPEELAKKAAAALESLIAEHQRVPGNIPMALLDRIYERPKLKSQ